ncbi:MAG: radical SAM protein [Eubacteriales bacterium]|nr:radical SAM protein [Eubacteriales bacterium]
MDFSNCTLCPRACHADRLNGQHGYCGIGEKLLVARAALHMWEEPCISGEKGAGAVFFSGCSLRCIYCQNHQISSAKRGKEISTARLAEIFLGLEEKGAANLELVTGAHYIPQIVEALDLAKRQGLELTVIYNSSGYESVCALKLLEGYVDVYLPDFKYMDRELAKAFSNASDYPEVAGAAIQEMLRQTGECVFDQEGYIQKGTIVRHLILPGHTKNSIQVLEYLRKAYGDRIYVSLMNQYTPVCPSGGKYPQLDRRLTRREYEKVLNHALELGLEKGFWQEGETAGEGFIPEFDGEGV